MAQVRTPSDRPPTPPGEMLLEEFIRPLGMTQAELADRIGVSYVRSQACRAFLNREVHAVKACWRNPPASPFVTKRHLELGRVCDISADLAQLRSSVGESYGASLCVALGRRYRPGLPPRPCPRLQALPEQDRHVALRLHNLGIRALYATSRELSRAKNRRSRDPAGVLGC